MPSQEDQTRNSPRKTTFINFLYTYAQSHYEKRYARAPLLDSQNWKNASSYISKEDAWCHLSKINGQDVILGLQLRVEQTSAARADVKPNAEQEQSASARRDHRFFTTVVVSMPIWRLHAIKPNAGWSQRFTTSAHPPLLESAPSPVCRGEPKIVLSRACLTLEKRIAKRRTLLFYDL